MLDRNAFCELYDVSPQQIDVTKHNGCEFITTVNGRTFIDEKALIRRKEFRKKVWLKNHENYYILAKYGNDSEMARILEKKTDSNFMTWTTFLSYGLFSLSNERSSLLNYKITPLHWSFYRVVSRIARKIKKREESIYKRLPNRDRYEEITKLNLLYSWEKENEQSTINKKNKRSINDGIRAA